MCSRMEKCFNGLIITDVGFTSKVKVSHSMWKKQYNATEYKVQRKKKKNDSGRGYRKSHQLLPTQHNSHCHKFSKTKCDHQLYSQAFHTP